LLFLILASSFSTEFRIISIEGNSSSIVNEFDMSSDYCFEEISEFDESYGVLSDIFVENNIAFIASERNGLLIFNVVNSNNPELVGSLDFERNVTIAEPWTDNDRLSSSIYVIDKLAFLADGANGLQIINISDLQNPYLVGNFPTSNRIFKVIVKGNFAYLLSGNFNLFQIVNVSNPSSPFLVSEIDFKSESGLNFIDFVLVDNFVFIITLLSLIAIDVTDPSSISEVSRLEGISGSYIEVYNEYAVVSSGSKLKFFNISNPYSMVYLNQSSFNVNYIADIVIQNSTAFISDSRTDIIISINISDIYNPIPLGNITNFGLGSKDKKLFSVLNQDNQSHLYCADSNLGLLTINYTDILSPTLLSQFSFVGRITSLAIDEENAFLCSWKQFPYYPSSMEIISIDNITNPKRIGSFLCENNTIMDIEISGNLAFLSIATFGLYIINISNPVSPYLIGAYNDNNSFHYDLKYDISNSLVYLTSGIDGLLIIDCSNPHSPSLIANFQRSGFSFTKIFIQDNFAYLGSGIEFGALVIVNIENPNVPFHVSTTMISNLITSIFVLDDKLYMSGFKTPLYIYDITDKNSPIEQDSFSNGYLGTQAIAGNESFIFVAQFSAGLRVLDITSRKIKEIAGVRDKYSGLSNDVEIQNGYIFLADNWDGLEIYQLTSMNHLSITAIILIATLIPCGIIILSVIIISWKRVKK
ncbi:MAG: LVIVD repeat-containing protein, partial [Candidatus Heimdallarchaeota archaeon]